MSVIGGVAAIVGLLVVMGIFTAALAPLWTADKGLPETEARSLAEFAGKVATWVQDPPVNLLQAQERLTEAEARCAAYRHHDEALTMASALAGLPVPSWRIAADARWMALAELDLDHARRAYQVAAGIAQMRQSLYDANRHG